jgi:hypothetical protein
VTGIKLYRSYVNAFGTGADSVYLVAIVPNTSAVYTDTKADAALGAGRLESSEASGIGTPPGDQATVTIPTSGDGRTVGRKIYRSDAGAPYRFLTTVSNNTALQYIDNTASVASGATAPTTDTTGGAPSQVVALSGLPIGTALVTARKLYRTASYGTQLKLLATIANNTATTYTDTKADATLGPAPPATNTAVANQVLVTLPIGGAGVTGRSVFRSAANTSALKFLGVVNDNTTTTFGPDTNPDSAIAGNVPPPTVDTSGLKQPEGQVLPGATTIIVANAEPFLTGGGWAVIGNGAQVIRYTGKTANALTGIPATGVGAIVATVAYNSTITAASVLLGITGILETMIKGSPMHVWVQRDDVAAQQYMAGLDGGGDGVYEHIWSDERRSEASLRQVCEAQLALYSKPLVTVQYASRDRKTKSGKVVTVALTSPAIQESLTIQDVTITELGIRGLAPKFTVSASNVHQSFEAVLQMLIRKADA